MADAIGTPAVASEKMLRPLHRDVLAEYGTEERELSKAKLGAGTSRLMDGAVILNQTEAPIPSAVPLSHVALGPSNLHEGSDAILDRATGSRHLLAVTLSLPCGELSGQPP